MSTCRWCTPCGLSTLDFLKEYASKGLSGEEALSANDDLSYCLECVVEYHKARDDIPILHKDLWEFETSRLVAQFQTSLKDESLENEELYFVDEYGEDKLPEFMGPDFEKNLRVPLLEILKYPYLLLDEKISDLCVEALCKMERLSYSFQVFDKLPGIYLLLVHPNDMIRRWAILTARTLGKVDRDDYYDLQEVFTCLFKVIELGLFDSPDIYSSYAGEKGKLILLPPHLYDTSNYKNYWLGICMLLSVLEEQAMDSLLLGPDKQNDFMQSILHTMERDSAGDGDDPFWPALHCFMVILDKLGAKVWGQLIDPVQAFQTIIDSRSYKNEIENVRNSTRRTKIEPDLDNCDNQVSCSQMIYDFNSEKTKKASGWRNAICPDYCPNMYEEMQTLTNVLQSDIGQDMRVHNSTFLWFIPFVQSVMDLKDLGVAYIVEVIHHLYSEIKDVLHKRVDYCDKVTEFFILILVSVIELHRSKKCLHLLWVSSQKWVEALVKCAKLPAKDFQRYSEKMPGNSSRISSTSSPLLPMHSQAMSSVQYSCAQLIRSLLKEGSQLGQQSSCKRFLDILNRLLRANIFVGLQLSERETQDLQVCLKQVVRSSKDRDSNNTFVMAEPISVDRSSPLNLSRIKNEDTDEWCRMKAYCQRNSLSPSSPSESRSAGRYSLSPPTRSRQSSLVEESLCKEPFLCEETRCPLPQKESGVSIPSIVGAVSEQFHEANTCVPSQNPLKTSPDELDMRNTSPLCAKSQAGQHDSACAIESVKLHSSELAPSFSEPSANLAKLKIVNVNIVDLQSKLAKAMEKSSTFLKIPKRNVKLETQKDNIQSNSRSSFREHAEDSESNLKNVTGPDCFSPCIKQEPEEKSVNPCIALEKPKDSSRSNRNENNEGMPLMQLTNTTATVEKNDSTICSDNVKGCSLYEKLQLLGDQQPSDVLGNKHVKSIDNVMVAGLDGSTENTKDTSRASESDSDDSIPLTQVRSNLLNQRKCLTPSMGNSEDSDVDGNVGNLPLTSQPKSLESPFDSRASCIVLQPEDHIVRKVKGNVRSSICANRNIGDLAKEIIVISDSASEEEVSDEENSILTFTKPIKMEQQSQENENTVVQHSLRYPSVTEKNEIKQEANLQCEFADTYDEYDSQFFEFETEDEVYSVWQDSQVKHPSSVDTKDSAKTLVPTENRNNNLEELDWQEKCTEWGYDTDYISEDAIEEAAEAAEEKLAEKDLANMQSLESETVAGKFHKLPASKVHVALSNETDDKPQVSMVSERLLKNAIVKTKPLVASKKSHRMCKVINENLARKKSSTIETSSKSFDKKVPKGGKQRKKGCAETNLRVPTIPRTTPAVVPPKKVRKCPEPSSVAERLGFRKPPRKAFDLSQRSLDSMNELRNHGKVVGALEIKKKQKTMFTCAQNLPLKGNGKLLACQDRQFNRQVRHPEVAKLKRVEELSKSSKSNDQSNTVVKLSRNKTLLEHTALTATSSKYKVEKTISGKAVVSGKEKHLHTATKETLATELTKSAKGVNIASAACDLAFPDCIVPDLKAPEKRATTHSTVGVYTDLSSDNFSACLASSSSKGLQGSMQHKVQGEPRDDEDEMEVDNLFLTQPDPVDMEICSQSEIFGSIEMLTKRENAHLDVNVSSEVDTTSVHLPSDNYKCNHSDCVEMVGMSGLYCSNHVVAEKSDHIFAIPVAPAFPKPVRPTTAKIFSSGAPSRSASLSKELENIPKTPALLKSKSQGLSTTAPKMKPPLQTKDLSLRQSNSCSVLQDLNNQSNIEKGQAIRAAVYTSYSPTKPRDHNFLIQEILCWSYEMFMKFSQFGSPNNLSQFPCSNIPLSFSGYEEYFGIFFPLLMLNTFESMVQEWLENQRRKSWARYELQLQNFCTDSSMNRVDFQVWIRDADLVKQLHLKEDDLIFLQKARDPNSANAEKAQYHYSVESDSCVEPRLYIGHVARFSRSQMNEMRNGEKYTACHLTVQTKGNFSGARNQLALCEVIGSLVSTQRQFKALLQFRWSPLAKPIINPSPPEFMPKSQVNIVTEFSYSKDYNENQRKAIETAYAMVKQHPTLSRICLIHGPPGTGKSKTIVGLLYRILIENPANENRIQNTNAKNKRDRILVCAPSNAGIDELMKKIILGFKEKSKDKNNFLGNCGDINLVRLGSEKAISSDVQKFSLDSQVGRRMDRDAFILDQDIQKKKETMDRRLDELSRQRAMERCDKQKRNQDLDQEIGRLSRERQQIASQLKEVRKHLPEVQGKIILESDVICCTLNTSGSFLLESAFRRLGHDPFSCVIVDEAGQACEVEALIPLIHRCSKLILVGDPEQLPATVISTKAESYGYGQSLMARLRKRLDDVASKTPVITPVIQLTVQYRMHPDICLFPSAYIYGKTLRTDRMTEEMRCSSDWPFQPYLLFDVLDGSEQRENDSSYANVQEVKLVIALVKLIKNRKREIGFRNIGIITPYRAQKNMIIKELDKEFGKLNRPGEVDTVDGFQGRQKDCIIVTCVRANARDGSIGFLASRQRLNVTITRAKSSLFILGSMKTLMDNKDWNELIQDAFRRGAIIRTREETYSKDVTKILKPKPALLRSSSFPCTEKPKNPVNSILQHTPPRTKRKESTNVLNTSLPPQPPPQPAPQVVDSKMVPATVPGSVAPPSATPAQRLPTLHERPRDPRLARSTDSVVAVTQPRNSGRTLLQGPAQTLHGQNSAMLGNPLAVNLCSGSRTQQAIPSSATSKNTETRTPWHIKRDMVQSNWKGYPAHEQSRSHRNYHSGSKRGAEHSMQSEGAKKRYVSSSNKPLHQ